MQAISFLPYLALSLFEMDKMVRVICHGAVRWALSKHDASGSATTPACSSQAELDI